MNKIRGTSFFILTCPDPVDVFISLGHDLSHHFAHTLHFIFMCLAKGYGFIYFLQGFLFVNIDRLLPERLLFRSGELQIRFCKSITILLDLIFYGILFFPDIRSPALQLIQNILPFQGNSLLCFFPDDLINCSLVVDRVFLLLSLCFGLLF